MQEHLAFAEALEAIVDAQEDLRSMGVATSMEAAARAAVDRPDVALVSLEMARSTSIPVASLAQRIVATTSVVDLPTFEAAKELGATGFVGEHAPMTEFLAALRSSTSRMTVGGTTLELLIAAAAGWLDLGDRRRPAPPAELDLTPREREVLDLMRDGLDAKRMAEVLHVSVHTARSHIKRVLAKLGAHSQLEAVAIANRMEPRAARRPPR